jgi:hypothetical protein
MDRLSTKRPRNLLGTAHLRGQNVRILGAKDNVQRKRMIVAACTNPRVRRTPTPGFIFSLFACLNEANPPRQQMMMCMMMTARPRCATLHRHATCYAVRSTPGRSIKAGSGKNSELRLRSLRSRVTEPMETKHLYPSQVWGLAAQVSGQGNRRVYVCELAVYNPRNALIDSSYKDCSMFKDHGGENRLSWPHPDSQDRSNLRIHLLTWIIDLSLR